MALTIDTLLLDSVYTPAAENAAVSKAPIDKFIEDPKNPRFEHQQCPDFDDDIKQHGILQPLVVVIDPETGKFMIRFGSRRYRAAVRVGLEEIPYVITEDPRQLDDYAQVAENEQREDLTPLELATFIKRKLDEGDKKKIIAQKLHKDAGTITHYLALIDAPAFIMELYHSHKCRSPHYLYQLRNLYNKNAECVMQYCAQSPEITKTTIEFIIQEVGIREHRQKHLEKIKTKLDTTLTDLEKYEEADNLASKIDDTIKGNQEEAPKPAEDPKEEKPHILQIETKRINYQVQSVKNIIDKLGKRKLKVINHPNGSQWTMAADALLVGILEGYYVEIFTFMTTPNAENLIVSRLGDTQAQAFEVKANRVQLIGIFPAFEVSK